MAFGRTRSIYTWMGDIYGGPGCSKLIPFGKCTMSNVEGNLVQLHGHFNAYLTQHLS